MGLITASRSGMDKLIVNPVSGSYNNLMGSMSGNASYGRFIASLESFHMRGVASAQLERQLFATITRTARHVEKNLDSEHAAKILMRYRGDPARLQTKMAEFRAQLEKDIKTYFEATIQLLNLLNNTATQLEQMPAMVFSEMYKWLQQLEVLALEKNADGTPKYVLPPQIAERLSKDWLGLTEQALRDAEAEIKDLTRVAAEAQHSRAKKISFFESFSLNWLQFKGSRALDRMFRNKKYSQIVGVYNSLQQEIQTKKPRIDFLMRMDYLIDNFKYFEKSRQQLHNDLLREMTMFEDMTSGLYSTVSQTSLSFQYEQGAAEVNRLKSQFEDLRKKIYEVLNSEKVNTGLVGESIKEFANQFQNHLILLRQVSENAMVQAKLNPYNRPIVEHIA